MSLSIGSVAPDFALMNTEKKVIKLSEFKGKKNVLVLFFPFAFTSVCTKELCDTRDNLRKYESLDAVVFGISVDSAFTLKAFKEEQAINFDLLSDFNKETAKAYGALYESFINYYNGVAKRSAFIVGKDGLIKYAEVLESAGDLPNFTAIEETLRSL
jgi:peroxiredoxin